MSRSLAMRREIWPIAGAFTISRGSKTAAEVVVVETTDGAVTGRGECTPYRRYGETVAGVTAAIETAGVPHRRRPRSRRVAGRAKSAPLPTLVWGFSCQGPSTVFFFLSSLYLPSFVPFLCST
jgi:L-alanine-DL-glutamate epimerase-like enolase superfamily enzyme